MLTKQRYIQLYLLTSTLMLHMTIQARNQGTKDRTDPQYKQQFRLSSVDKNSFRLKSAMIDPSISFKFTQPNQSQIPTKKELADFSMVLQEHTPHGASHVTQGTHAKLATNGINGRSEEMHKESISSQQASVIRKRKKTAFEKRMESSLGVYQTIEGKLTGIENIVHEIARQTVNIYQQHREMLAFRFADICLLIDQQVQMLIGVDKVENQNGNNDSKWSNGIDAVQGANGTQEINSAKGKSRQNGEKLEPENPFEISNISPIRLNNLSHSFQQKEQFHKKQIQHEPNNHPMSPLELSQSYQNIQMQPYHTGEQKITRKKFLRKREVNVNPSEHCIPSQNCIKARRERTYSKQSKDSCRSLSFKAIKLKTKEAHIENIESQHKNAPVQKAPYQKVAQYQKVSPSKTKISRSQQKVGPSHKISPQESIPAKDKIPHRNDAQVGDMLLM